MEHVDDEKFYATTCLYWGRNVSKFIQGKPKDKKAYDEKLRAAFAGPKPDDC